MPGSLQGETPAVVTGGGDQQAVRKELSQDIRCPEAQFLSQNNVRVEILQQHPEAFQIESLAVQIGSQHPQIPVGPAPIAHDCR